MKESDLIIDESVSRDDEAQIHATFERLVEKHLGGSAGLTLLPYDPDTYPYQRLDVVAVRGNRVDTDTVRALGNAAYPYFEEIEEQFRERDDLLNHIALTLMAGHDVLTLYDHSSIINGAVVGAAARCALFSFAGEELHADLNQVREDIIMSKITTRLAALGSIPVPEILSNAWDTYFSIPPSRSIRGAGIPEPTRKSINKAMLERYAPIEPVAPKETGFGAIHIIHGSGATDVERRSGIIAHRQRTIHMGPISTGTVALMGNSVILPIGSVLEDKGPLVSIGHLRRPITTPEQANGIMGHIAAMNEETTGHEYIYHPTEESFEAAIDK